MKSVTRVMCETFKPRDFGITVDEERLTRIGHSEMSRIVERLETDAILLRSKLSRKTETGVIYSLVLTSKDELTDRLECDILVSYDQNGILKARMR